MGIADKRQMIFTLTELGKKKMQEMKKYQIDLDKLVGHLTNIVKA